MRKSLSTPTIQERLEYAVANGDLPNAVADTAMLIIGRLDLPMRLILLGMPKSGKSAVLNLLVGTDLIPDELQNLPTMQVEEGTTPQMICALPDGRQVVVPGTDLSALEAINPVFVTVEIDLPALSKISLLEVVASDNLDVQRKAISWACKRADVVIWCTEDFTPDEQELWYDVPDRLKDHAFLLWTKTDLLAGQADVNTLLTDLKKMSGDEFLRILPLSAKSALDIRASETGFNLGGFKASGATALISAIKAEIDSSHRAARDHGEHILAKYCSEIDFSGLNDSPAMPSHEPDLTISATDTSNEKAPVEILAESEDQNTTTLSDLDKAILDKALAAITVYAAGLAEMLEKPEEWPVDRVLLACEETVAKVLEILEEESGSSLAEICATAFEIQVNIMLMQSEDGDSRADSAITLILQIRREIEAKLA